MTDWKCCRTCSSGVSLNPIFVNENKNSNYSDVLLMITGLEIKPDDELPQEMCITCLNIINNFIKFRKNCKIVLNTLLERLKLQQLFSSKENGSLIGDDVDSNKDTSDNFDCIDFDACDDKSGPTNENFIELELTVEEVLQKNLSINFYNVSYENFKAKKFKSDCNSDLNDNDEDNKCDKNDINYIYQCDYCQKTYKNKLSYASHCKIHTGLKVICEHCGKQFLDKRRLLMHCKAKHGYYKTDKCTYCDYRGISSESVKIHERIHTGERPYVCELCSASFHRKSSYLQHKPIHLTEKTVQCDLCPALFKSTTLMKIHRSRHKPREYKHKCLECDTSFSKRWHALRHIARVHGISERAETHLLRVKINDVDR